ncbi:MAG: signal peptidase II [Candidatus Viridilinea halotolerans]|uniref:Lipoprotein signal peptidase n=1 Tax=Candidatus Viridilinea halotolerans TaxID=2491704 RepID=A0A426TUS9_9CHLR|nr:MAG: signal peptidase II [Candidatus Viridilinea halotolerans]
MRSSVQQRNRRVWMIPSGVATVGLILDQLSKWWVAQTLGPITMTHFIPLFGETVRIAYSHNTGVAFSLFQGHSEILTLTAILILAGAIYFYRTQMPNERFSAQLTLGLILGGALGNIVDRVRLGYVVDFIQVGWWPIFNLADSLICVGAGLLMLQILRDDLRQAGHGNNQALRPQ